MRNRAGRPWASCHWHGPAPAASDPDGLPDADLSLFDHFFDESEADRLHRMLTTEVPWQQDRITVYGRTLDQPRLTAWHADPGKTYAYSGIRMHPRPWTPALLAIKARVEDAAQAVFNSVLLNLYRSGRDSVGWHRDDEPELGRNPVIASVSLGATRMFQMRHVARKDLGRIDIPLGHGSLLLMCGTTQHCWEHQVPKTARPVGPRINLTFRRIR